MLQYWCIVVLLEYLNRWTDAQSLHFLELFILCSLIQL
jgi:hypothetical protein